MTKDEQEMLRIGRRLGWGDTLDEVICHWWIAPDWRDLYHDVPAAVVLGREGLNDRAALAKAYCGTVQSGFDALEVARLDLLDAFGPVVKPIVDAMLWVMARLSRKPA